MAALLDLRMPGVYTQEIPTLPPTVGVIPSAVPIFIGYTEKADKKGDDLYLKGTRVKSMFQYEEWFGGAPLSQIEVAIDDRETNAQRPAIKIHNVSELKHKMYHAMRFYYMNGGGPCFIMSVGNYDSDLSKDALISGIQAAIKVRDATIMVFPDGTSLNDTNYKDVISKALQHCEKMKNRVTIIDVRDFGEDLEEIENVFQTNMPTEIDFKKYGMAYYPFLETGLSYAYAQDEVSVIDHIQTLSDTNKAQVDALATDTTNALNALFSAKNALNGAKKKKEFLSSLKTAVEEYPAQLSEDEFNALSDEEKDQRKNIGQKILMNINKMAARAGQTVPGGLKDELDTGNGKPTEKLDEEITNATTELDTANTEYDAKKTEYDTAKKKAIDGITSADGKKIRVYTGSQMSGLVDDNNLLYGKIKDAIAHYPVIMPPSSAMAGVYVRTDATQGVWKAPANVSVFGAIKPIIDIDDDLHANLNAPSNGKSINAIRTYPGRGLLVYGGRTLAGNDLEWRFVNVRRTFCFIEDSIARAMLDFVFEPNTQQTWIKVRAMIKSFLNRLWKAGGLFGNTPEDAYEVVVGEPESMSVDDVLAGIMRVFIKVAVSRPAEFIVLQYEHKFELVEA